MRRVLVTATPPTPNGDLHLGHMAGPYIAADIHVRFLRQSGASVEFLTGIDDHQTYVDVRATRDGSDPASVADRFGDRIEAAWRAANVDFDVCARPRTSENHIPVVQAFFRRLLDDGHLELRTAPLPYCAQCRRFLFEAYVRGGCPHCGNASGGNACEACGRPNDCADLADPHCVLCGTPALLREVPRLYFPLARHTAALTDFWSEVAMPPHLVALCEAMLRDGLPAIAVSHPSPWGIPVPSPMLNGQRIYVWFEMAPGYLAAAEPRGRAGGDADAGGSGWEPIWKDPDTEVVQFFGFDNGYFHAVLFPALFRAYDPGIRLASSFVVNEFYQLDGLKFSTSRRHAIWALDFLQDHSSDRLRYFLSQDRPAVSQTSFSLSGFDLRTRQRLVEGWQAWLRDLGRRTLERHGGRVPHGEVAGGAFDSIRRQLARAHEDMEWAYGRVHFSPRQAVRVLDQLVDEAADLGRSHRFLDEAACRPEAVDSATALELSVAKALAVMSWPLMPEFAQRLWAVLGLEANGSAPAWNEALVPMAAGRRIGALAAAQLLGDE